MDMSYLYVIFIAIVVKSTAGRRIVPEGKCTFSRVYKMLGADCSSLNLVNIPNSTRDVEVLDASINRIRILRNDSFKTYTNLKFLYLNDNSISIIEPAAFEPLRYLEVLDLSLNAIRDLPPLLPPYLRRLYIAENVIETAPLSSASSLQYLSLADCHLTQLPNLGELPQLRQLNLTLNPLETIKVEQLASFCNLENLLLPHSLMQSKFLSTCDCVKVSAWVVKNSMYVNPKIENCTIIDETECETNSTIESDLFASCQLAYQQRLVGAHWTYGIVGVIVILLLSILLFVLWRRKWKKPAIPQPQPSQEEVRKRKLLKQTRSKTSLKF